MVSPFETIIQRLWDLGFFTYFLPYMLTSAIFYGLLRKSQIFGPPERNVAVNAAVALSAALFVWASPIILGVNPGEFLARFFVQGMVATLVVIVSILSISAFFGPNFAESFAKLVGGKPTAIFVALGIIIGIAIFFSSGVVSVFYPSGMYVPADVLTTVVTVILFVIFFLVIAWVIK